MVKNNIVYSKKDGVNRLLKIDSNSELMELCSFIERNFEEHKYFAYVLINGIEIKLF